MQKITQIPSFNKYINNPRPFSFNFKKKMEIVATDKLQFFYA